MTYEEFKELWIKYPNIPNLSEETFYATSVVTVSSSLLTKEINYYYEVNSSFPLKIINPQEYAELVLIDDMLTKVMAEQRRMKRIEQDFLT
jgi:hypothetical protein